LDFLDPMVNATGSNPVPIATIPFRGNRQRFLRDPVFFVRFASRCGFLSCSGDNIFVDHSVNFGFGFRATLGYPAQGAHLRLPAHARRLRR
jgi:hypothetical protein